MGLNQMDIWKTIRSDKRFDKSLENRYYDSISPTSHHNASSSSTNNSLSQRIQSYKFKKSKLQKAGGCPIETKIHKTPLSKKSKHFKLSEQAKENEFESRDPRFDANIERNPNESGWKLRNAYKFLDEYIERDVQMIKTQIKKHKKAIKFTKKNAPNFDENIGHLIKENGVAVDALKSELIKIQNRKNRISEKDLEQKSRSQMRKMELDQVRTGQKMPYHHTLKRTRFGGVKWQTNKDGNGDRPNIQNIYLENKYKQLKEDGKYEKYVKKKRKRVNSRYKAALQKKSGRGWNDN